MEESILKTVKAGLGISDTLTAFDPEITMYINSAFSVLHQLGVGPDNGFSIDDADTEWDTYTVPEDQLSMVKTYLTMKTRLAFDPPATSFGIEAIQKEIDRLEWRLNVARELIAHPLVIVEVP